MRPFTFRESFVSAVAGCLIGLSIVLATATLASAQMMGVAGGPFTVGGAYTGPGDQVASAVAFYSCTRGYSAAYATGSNNACQLRRASDNTTQNIVILSNGAFDSASANTFATQDATCTGTIASTTLTCASASSTPHAGSTLTGSGITQPSYIISCGTFTGGAGTCTLNAAQTVSVGETITMQYGLYASEVYDESGSGNHVLQSTIALQPQWLPNCGSTVNSLPCLLYTGTQWMATSGNFTTTAQPNTVVAIAERTGAFTTVANLFAVNTSSVSISPNVNQLRANLGSPLDYTGGSDSVLHSLQYVTVATPLTSVYIDSTISASGAQNAGSAPFSGAVGFMSASVHPVTGYIGELGVWGSAFSGGQVTSVCHNQRLYYATPGSC